MTQKPYRIKEGSLHEQFQSSRAKIQMFGGGFGNGKTTAGVVKAIQLARDYPGSNGLVARSTYPKLTNTIRKEFRTWVPKSWVKRDIDSKQNLMEFTNGSVINFSHIQQTGKTQESSTSNLLSATYDWILIDQVEDPEISHKDYLDLLGRLRGQTLYQGEDESMPQSGPRWMMLLCNPTRNWVYQKLVKPLKDKEIGIPNPDFALNEKGKPLIELYEGSTYTNAENLPSDFIHTQEAQYKGQMRRRFLLGEWGAYEGLIYPEYDQSIHMVNHNDMEEYYEKLVMDGANMIILESYDHGMAVPACYLFGFADNAGNVCIMDGYYEKEKTVSELSKGIHKIRSSYGCGDGSTSVDHDPLRVLADPAVFRRSTGEKRTVGVKTSGLFRECGIIMTPGNNEIINGIAKVQSYMFIDEFHKNPFTGVSRAPRVFFSKRLEFIDRELVDYYWKKDTSGEYEDEPQDKNDHAMDAIKYMFTKRPRVVTFRMKTQERFMVPDKYMRWRDAPEQDMNKDNRRHRHVAG